MRLFWFEKLFITAEYITSDVRLFGYKKLGFATVLNFGKLAVDVISE